MNTPHKHAELIHAFADGKMLQFRHDSGLWNDWVFDRCPDMRAGNWRIKPPEPIKVIAKAYEDTNGYIYWNKSVDLTNRHGWLRCPEFDIEVTLPAKEVK